MRITFVIFIVIYINIKFVSFVRFDYGQILYPIAVFVGNTDRNLANIIRTLFCHQFVTVWQINDNFLIFLHDNSLIPPCMDQVCMAYVLK